jgi:hypothetical protein
MVDLFMVHLRAELAPGKVSLVTHRHALFLIVQKIHALVGIELVGLLVDSRLSTYFVVAALPTKVNGMVAQQEGSGTDPVKV